MFDIGFTELVLFGVIALIVLGPEKLPQAARTAGQWYSKIRRTVSTLQSEIEAELDLAETRQQMQKELAKIRETEAEMRREMDELRGNIHDFEYAQNQQLKGKTNSTNNDDADLHDSATTQLPHDRLDPNVVDLRKGSQDDRTQTNNSSNINTSDTNNHRKPAAFDYAYASTSSTTKTDSLKSADATSTITNVTTTKVTTRPWENMWFRLGAYDKARRLPAPPYLPNYKADTLLHARLDNAVQNHASIKSSIKTSEAE